MAPEKVARKQAAEIFDDEYLEAILKLKEELDRFRREVRLVRSEEMSSGRPRERPEMHPARGRAHRRGKAHSIA